mmetsp:Transcript_22034/g.62702  ORF Transcript_22034/g.62702 Transcript_22034/m.62702 type:complete len:230 (+) Transcript_22034:70-759(+)
MHVMMKRISVSVANNGDMQFVVYNILQLAVSYLPRGTAATLSPSYHHHPCIDWLKEFVFRFVRNDLRCVEAEDGVNEVAVAAFANDDEKASLNASNDGLVRPCCDFEINGALFCRVNNANRLVAATASLELKSSRKWAGVLSSFPVKMLLAQWLPSFFLAGAEMFNSSRNSFGFIGLPNGIGRASIGFFVDDGGDGLCGGSSTVSVIFLKFATNFTGLATGDRNRLISS